MDRNGPPAARERPQQIAGEAGRHDIGREPRHHVVGAISHRHDRNDEADRRAADERGHDPDEELSLAQAPTTAANGAHEHHPRGRPRTRRRVPRECRREPRATAASRCGWRRRGSRPFGAPCREDEQHRDALDHDDQRRGHADLPLHRERARFQHADNSDAGTTANGSNAPSSATVTALKPKPSEKPSIRR